MTTEIASSPRKPWYRLSLTAWIMIGLVVGGFIGWIRPDWGNKIYFLRDIFLNLIKSVIAPLVFSTLVVGIAGGGDLKKVGRMGAKALLYFEIVTTIALFIGLLVVNLIKPGVGVTLAAPVTETVQKVAENHPKTLIETIVHIFPASIVDAMVRGDVLQIVAFAVLFAMALSAIGEKGKPILRAMESLSQIMFRFTSYVMMFAPIGVGAAMAHTIGTQGLGVLVNLGKLIGSLYLALIIFVVFVLGTVAILFRVPIRKFLRAVREPATIAFATTSSESALPKAMEVMERLGVPPRIVGFVMPTGYSFNLDGTTLYLAMASVFVAQAAEATTGIHMGFGQQIVMMLTLMVTSKGVAARAARLAGDPAGDAQQFPAGGPRPHRRRRDLRRRRADGHGAHLRQRHRQLPGHLRRGPLGRRVRRSTGKGVRHAGGDPPRPRRRRARLRAVGADGRLRGSGLKAR